MHRDKLKTRRRKGAEKEILRAFAPPYSTPSFGNKLFFFRGYLPGKKKSCTLTRRRMREILR